MVWGKGTPLEQDRGPTARSCHWDMVVTFVPYTDFQQIAKSLDYRRLGKQRVEAYQIWKVLTQGGKAWRNHPATKAWEGCTCALAVYTNTMIREWVSRGYKNTMQLLPHCANPKMPWWWGWEPVHASHRAVLNRKKPDFYSFGDTGEHANWGYVWPSKVPVELRMSIKPHPKDLLCDPALVSS